MATSLKTLFLALLSLSLLNLSSCKKEEDPDANETDSTLDFALADGIFGDAGNIAEQSEDGSVETFKTGGILSQCATVTIDIPIKRITIDFGTVNCTCVDTKNRRGVVYVDYTGPFHNQGSSYVVSFNNYFVNDHKIMGTRTVTNNGLNANNHMNYTVVDANGQIVKPNNGGTILWASTRNNEWIEGDTTLTWLDDVWLVTGSSNGTSSAGTAFTATITTALRVQVGCRWITAGAFDFTPGTLATRTINYGTGTCDNAATLSIGAYSANIVLP